MAGFNGTVFAYGQTGGGKTWTMEVLTVIIIGTKPRWCVTKRVNSKNDGGTVSASTISRHITIVHNQMLLHIDL